MKNFKKLSKLERELAPLILKVLEEAPEGDHYLDLPVCLWHEINFKSNEEGEKFITEYEEEFIKALEGIKKDYGKSTKIFREGVSRRELASRAKHYVAQELLYSVIFEFYKATGTDLQLAHIWKDGKEYQALNAFTKEFLSI